MLLRAAIVMLVMLNIGAALWWLVGPDAAPTSASAAARAAAAPTLRMLDEAMPPPAKAAPPPPVEPAPAVAAAAPAAETAEPLPVAATEPAPPPAAVCLRFGPFDAADARDAARAALAGAGVQGVVRESPARAARGWKVSMPAFPSRAEAVAMAERLRAAGVSDLYVMGDAAGSDANSIALGRYGSEEAARRRQADLRGRGFSAQAEPLGDVPMQAWLDARIPAGVDPASLRRIAAARALDCAGLR